MELWLKRKEPYIFNGINRHIFVELLEVYNFGYFDKIVVNNTYWRTGLYKNLGYCYDALYIELSAIGYTSPFIPTFIERKLTKDVRITVPNDYYIIKCKELDYKYLMIYLKSYQARLFYTEDYIKRNFDEIEPIILTREDNLLSAVTEKTNKIVWRVLQTKDGEFVHDYY